MYGVRVRWADEGRWRFGAAPLVAVLLALRHSPAGAAPGPVTEDGAANLDSPDVVPDQYIVALREEADSHAEAEEAVRAHTVTGSRGGSATAAVSAR